MSRAVRASRAMIAVSSFMILVLVAACSGNTFSATPTGSPGPSSLGPAPKPTAWPASTIEGSIALGAADGEIWKAGVDLRKAAETENVQLMWGAADGLVKLLDGNMPNLAGLKSYPATADLGAALESSYGALRTAAAQIRDSITAGDSAAIVDGFTKLTAAIDAYANSRQALADAALQALFMKRVLNL